MGAPVRCHRPIELAETLFGLLLPVDETMIAMDSRQAELSRTIDRAVLGRRIRNVRLAAGMTQGQLAEAVDVTTAYVSRIEAGQRRPEALRLEAMAKALRTSLDDLVATEDAPSIDLELQLKLDHAQLALTAGSLDEALVLVREIFDEFEGKPGFESFRWQVEFVRCSALEAQGDREGAIVGLERIAETPKADAAWIKVLIALSRCYRESGATKRAISVGEGAMATLDELNLSQSTEAVQLALTVAAAYSVEGDIDHAARICLRAVEDSVSIGSPVAQASAYWNASIMESRRGNIESAVTLAGRAVGLFEMADDLRNMGRLRTQLAMLQLDMDPPQIDEAASNLELGLREMEWSSATPTDRATNRLAAARVLEMRGDLGAALAVADEVIGLGAADAPMLAVEAHVVKGRWLANAGRMDDARRLFQDAALIASGVGADRDIAQVWFELGELLAQTGDSSGSGDAFRRAAATLGAASRSMRVNH